MAKQRIRAQVGVDEDPEVPADLIEATCDLLGLAGGQDRAAAATQFRTIASDYLIDLSLEPLWGTPKQQRVALRKLLKLLAGALMAMNSIAPEYAVALESLMDRPRHASQSIFGDARDRMLDLAFVLGRFDTEYRPNKGRPADVPLEAAIRKLIDVLHSLTNEFPKVQLNKHKGESPTLKSAGARAIGHLLRGVHPTVDEASIARMIEKVRRQPRPSETHLEALFRLDPNFELDCSLAGARTRH